MTKAVHTVKCWGESFNEKIKLIWKEKQRHKKKQQQ